MWALSLQVQMQTAGFRYGAAARPAVAAVRRAAADQPWRRVLQRPAHPGAPPGRTRLPPPEGMLLGCTILYDIPAHKICCWFHACA